MTPRGRARLAVLAAALAVAAGVVAFRAREDRRPPVSAPERRAASGPAPAPAAPAPTTVTSGLAASEPGARARRWVEALEAGERRAGSPPVSWEAVRELARRACGDAAGIRALLAEVPSLDAEETTRPRAIATIVALGRCASEDALRGLVALGDGPSLSAEARLVVFRALAQRRDPDSGMPKGLLTVGLPDHVNVSGPIAEPFVREALLRWYRAARVRERRDLLVALAASATVDEGVREELFAVLDDERWDSSRTHAFLHAAAVPASADVGLALRALEVVRRPLAADDVRVAVMTATQNPDARPLEAVLAFVSDPATPDALRREAYSGVAPAFSRDETAMRAYLALLRSAEAWAADHPTYEVSEKVDMREGAPPTITRESAHVALAPTFQNAYASGARQPEIRAVVVRFLLRGLETAPPDGLLFAFRSFAKPLTSDIALGLGEARPSRATLEALVAFFAKDGGDEVFAAIRASAARLPAAERDAVVARLRAAGR